MKRSTLLVAPAIFFVACSSPEKQPELPPPASAPEPAASIEAKQVAAQSGSSHVTEFPFAAKSTILNKEAGKKLQELLGKVNAEKIEQAKVITWADREYPPESKEQLTQRDIDLAEERGEKISAWLEKNKVSDVEIINMAKRPGTFASVVESDDQRIKEALDASGIDGKKRRAIVILLTKQ